MSKEKWWVMAGSDCGFALEQRPDGDLVVVNTTTTEEHALHGYVWMHAKHPETMSVGHSDIQIRSEGPPPYGVWVEHPEG